MQAKEDYPADISDIVEFVFLNTEQSLLQLNRLNEFYATDKTLKPAQDVVQQVSKSVMAVLNKTEDFKETVTTVAFEESEDAELEKSAKKEEEQPETEIEKKAVASINKFVPSDGLYIKSYGIPKAKLLNAILRCKVPSDETLFALIDLTPFGSSKNAVLFGTKGIYYHNDLKSKTPGPGFIAYKGFADSKITSSSTELYIGKECTIFVQNCRFKSEEFVSLLEDLQTVFGTLGDEKEQPEKKSKKKSKKKKKASSDEENQTQEDLQEKKDDEKKEEVKKPEGQLINFDDF